MKNDDTLKYYNENAQKFVGDTLNVAFSANQDRFLSLLKEGAYILDFGCGSGRDTRYFMEHGYTVDATDGSEEMVKLASENTGIQVKQMLFNELDETEKYDGIWACSSILHCHKEELPDVFERMCRALKKNGVIYTSFKYSTFEGERNGRYFTDFTEETFEEFMHSITGLSVEEQWISGDVRPGRSSEKWLNLILRKK